MFENGEKICIYGIGGFGREVLCCLLDIIAPTSVKIEEAVCFMVSDNYYKEDKVMGVNVIPQSKFEPEKFKVVVAVGDPVLRQGVGNTLPHGVRYAKIIHPGAVMAQRGGDRRGKYNYCRSNINLQYQNRKTCSFEFALNHRTRLHYR